MGKEGGQEAVLERGEMMKLCLQVFAHPKSSPLLYETEPDTGDISGLDHPGPSQFDLIRAGFSGVP